MPPLHTSCPARGRTRALLHCLALALTSLPSIHHLCTFYFSFCVYSVTVEELALLHYASAAGGGWHGVHCEGGAWATLWGLLMWDCLFADVPEVFR